MYIYQIQIHLSQLDSYSKSQIDMIPVCSVFFRGNVFPFLFRCFRLDNVVFPCHLFRMGTNVFENGMKCIIYE